MTEFWNSKIKEVSCAVLSSGLSHEDFSSLIESRGPSFDVINMATIESVRGSRGTISPWI